MSGHFHQQNIKQQLGESILLLQLVIFEGPWQVNLGLPCRTIAWFTPQKNKVENGVSLGVSMHDQSVTVSSPFTRKTTTPEDSPNSSSIDFKLPGCFFRSCSLVDPSRLIGCESALVPTFPSNSTRQHGVPVLDSSNITSSEWECHGSLGFF